MKLQMSFLFDTPSEAKAFIDRFFEGDRPKIEDMAKVYRQVESRKNRSWEQYEIEHIITNYHRYTSRVIGKSLNRTPASVQQMANKLIKTGALKKKRTNMPGRVIIAKS